MSLIDWFQQDEEAKKCLEELEAIHQEERKKYGWCDEQKKDGPQEVIIKPEALDTSSLEEEDKEDHLWRPSEWKHYIGQDNLKNIIQARINGCKKRNEIFPHMLIDGMAGTGKSTIALLTAKKLGVNLVECVSNTILSPQQFVDKLAEVNGGVLFVDETHEINRKIANFILPLLEDFKINGKRIKPFTFFGATTELGTLIKKYKPLVERMKIQKTLEPYTKEELVNIIRQFKEKTFSDENIEDNVFEVIANNCRNTPRMGLRILENYIFMNKPIKDVLRAEGIIKEGLTTQDIKILELLKEKEKGVGLNAISSFLGTSAENYLYKHESYLLQKGLITITSRRVITDQGKKFLKEVQNAKKKI